MITCPSCGYKDYEGALFCTECGTRLHSTSHLLTQVIASDTGSFTPPPPPEKPVNAPERVVELILLDHDAVIPLFQGQQVVLGRAVQGGSHTPDLDLSAFGAYQAGVSRRHALLHFDGDSLTITDLQSSNGTWVNEKRIPSRQPVWLQHGDVVRLGKLKFQIVFRKGD